MSQTYVPGPAEIYINLVANASTGWLFLGYSESGVRINWIRHYEDVMTDKAGPKQPADKQFMGMGALVSVDLKNFTHTNLNYVRRAIKGRSWGSMNAGDLGSLMIQQDNTIQVCIRQPYANASVWGGNTPFADMPEAYRFYHAVLIDDSEPVSVKAKVVPLVWEMMNYVNPCTGVGYFFDTTPGTLPTPC